MKMKWRCWKFSPRWLLLLSDCIAIFRMMKAYAEGRYRDIPLSLLVKIVLVIIYVIFFLDIVPDFIPFAGWLDDIAVCAWLVHSLRKDLEQFKGWEQKARSL